MNKLKVRIDSIAYKIRNIARATWGLNPQVIKNIYLLVIEKIILYGCNVWFRGIAQLLQKLPQLQRSSLLAITGCYRTVSNDALSVLSGCLPVDLVIRRELEYMKYIKDLETYFSGMYLNTLDSVYHIDDSLVEFKIK